MKATSLWVAVLSFGLILLVRLIAIADGRDVWLDEAMLAANFVRGLSAPILHPLPLFDQLTTPAYGLLMQVVGRAAGSYWDETLRIASACASLGAAFLLLRTLMAVGSWTILSKLQMAVLALTFGFLTPLSLRFSTEIKHYIFDLLSTALLLFLSVRLVERPGYKSLAMFAAGAIAIIPLSYMASIITASAGAGVFAHKMLRAGSRRFTKESLLLLLILLLLGVVNLLFYLVVARPLAEYQFSAYPDVYRQNFLGSGTGIGHAAVLLSRIPRFIVESVSPMGALIKADEPLAYFAFASAAALMIGVGFIHCLRTYPFFSVMAGIAIVLIYGLNWLKLLPVNTDQHFLFLLPLSAILAAAGVVSMISVAVQHYGAEERMAHLGWGTAAMILLSYAAAAASIAPNLERIEMAKLMERVERIAPRTPLWVYPQAQPVVRLIAPSSLKQIGIFNPRSSSSGWLSPMLVPETRQPRPEYYRRFRADIAGLTDIWLVFSNVAHADGAASFVDIARDAVGPCTLVDQGADSQLYRCRKPGP